MNRAIFLLPLFALLALPASGDRFISSNSCMKPSKPFEFRSEQHYQNFMNDVDRYRNCIDNFVDEQNAAAQRHLEAADNAVDEWNRFVRLELN